MKINEKVTNIELTGDVKNYLYKKLEYFTKFIDPSDESAICDVELGKNSQHHKNGDVFMAEINLHIAGKNFRVVSETDDLYSSIDLAKDDMVRILESNKDKKVSLMRRSGAKLKSLLKGFFNSNK